VVERPYEDRDAAGRVLAAQVRDRLGPAGAGNTVVLALPRGGVPVAAPVAAALEAPLDVLAVRKIGLPGHRELAMGAVAGVGDSVQVVRNELVLSRERVPEAAFQAVLEREVTELRRREAAYRGGRPPVAVRGRTVVIVDDGLATGSTMRAGVRAVRQQQPARVVVAVPVGSADTCRSLSGEADEVVCAWTPAGFSAVGQAYLDFSPVGDDEVRRVLAAAAGRQEAPSGGG